MAEDGIQVGKQRGKRRLVAWTVQLFSLMRRSELQIDQLGRSLCAVTGCSLPGAFFCFAIDLSIGRYFFHLDVIHLRKRESPLAALRTCRVTAGVDARLGLILAGASDFLKVSALISAVTRSLSTDLQPTHVCGVASKMDERCRFGRSG